MLVQTVADFEESLELWQRAADNPRVGGVVGWVDQTVDVADQVRVLRSAPGGMALVGLRHRPARDPPELVDPQRCRDGLRAVGAAGLVFDVVVSPEVLPLVIDCVAALPRR